MSERSSLLLDEKDISLTNIKTIDETLKKDILRLAIPATLEQILIMVVGVVSTIFMGRIGKEALSAVGLINILTNFILALFTALSTGSTVLVARLIGERNLKGAKEAVRQSLIIAISSSLFITVLCYVTADKIISILFLRQIGKLSD